MEVQKYVFGINGLSEIGGLQMKILGRLNKILRKKQIKNY